jgi:bifunctional non-homologous end joining protein LigD
MKALTKSEIANTPGTKAADMPRAIEPMKAVLVDKPFDRKGWIFEEKYDGIRAVCFIADGKAKIFSRNDKEMTMRYPELRDIPKWVSAKQAILDGEIIVEGSHGNASFQELSSRFGLKNASKIERLSKSQKIVYYVFDLLYIDGFNVMNASLMDRKALLKKIIQENKVFQFAPHTLANGIARFRIAERKRSEGIMAKNGESKYIQRRSNEWLKIKTSMRQEAVIVGYTAPQGSREFFGALLLGLYEGKNLVSVGKVGTGFDRRKLKEIFDEMKPYKTDKPSLNSPSSGRGGGRGVESTGVQWLKPKLVCEVKFTERTSTGSFRHPVFEGLRFDKKPTECTFEAKRETKKMVKTAESRSRDL